MTPTLRDTIEPVPPGMVRVADYGTFARELYTAVTVLEQATAALHGYPTAHLVHSTRGYETAGSCARWTEAYWAVRWSDGTCSHGQRFAADNEAGARAYFARLTDYEAVSARRQNDLMMEETVYAPARARQAAEAAERMAADKARKAGRRRANLGARVSA